MGRFTVNRTPFGRRLELAQLAGQDDLDEAVAGELPKPAKIKLAKRRAAGIAEAQAVLADVPAPGESLHCLCTARMDLTDVIVALGTRFNVCDRIAIATLGFNESNLLAMCQWLDGGAVIELVLVA